MLRSSFVVVPILVTATVPLYIKAQTYVPSFGGTVVQYSFSRVGVDCFGQPVNDHLNTTAVIPPPTFYTSIPLMLVGGQWTPASATIMNNFATYTTTLSSVGLVTSTFSYVITNVGFPTTTGSKTQTIDLNTGAYHFYGVEIFSGTGPSCVVVVNETTTFDETGVVPVILTPVVETALQIQLVDPVTGDPATSLLSGSAVTTDPALLADQSRGRTVNGVAADGVSTILIRIMGAPSNLDLSMSLGEDGGLANIGSAVFGSSITVQADSHGNAFALFRSPLDFARPRGVDDAASERVIHLKIALSANPAGGTTSTISIMRPPVVVIHGTWSNPTTWLQFTPLNPLNPDPRFDVFPVDYSGTELSGVIVSAASVLDQIKNNTNRFKTLFQVAAVQSDIVAHSLGGLVSRALAITPTFVRDENYQMGDVHKLITLDSTHLGTPLATNLIASNAFCKSVLSLSGQPVGQQIIDQAENSPLLLHLNSTLAPIHLATHAVVGHADPIQQLDAEDAPATAALENACPSLLPGGSFRTLYTSPSNPTGENDIVVGVASQSAAFSGLVGPIPISSFFSLIHAVSSISPQGPDVLNRGLINNTFGYALPTVPTVAEVVRLLNSSARGVDFAPIKP
jgi:pimeloyl-ACP methyl ester carboxylesterase